MKLGDPLLKSEVQKLEIKRTSEFVKDEGKLARVFKDKNGYHYLLKGERMVPLVWEDGDIIYNSNGTVRERVGGPTPIQPKIIDMTEEKKEEKEEEEKKRKEKLRWIKLFDLVHYNEKDNTYKSLQILKTEQQNIVLQVAEGTAKKQETQHRVLFQLSEQEIAYLALKLQKLV